MVDYTIRKRKQDGETAVGWKRRKAKCFHLHPTLLTGQAQNTPQRFLFKCKHRVVYNFQMTPIVALSYFIKEGIPFLPEIQG